VYVYKLTFCGLRIVFQFYRWYTTCRCAFVKLILIISKLWTGHGVPFFRYEDPFAVSWDTDWRPVANTTYHVDEIRYNNSDPKFYEDNTIEYSSPTGVGWDADLRTWAVPFGDLEKSVGGYGKVLIEEKEKGKTISHSIHAKYAHDTGANSSIGLNIKALSITLYGKAETRATQTDFEI
jgi:hypothetical protein